MSSGKFRRIERGLASQYDPNTASLAAKFLCAADRGDIEAAKAYVASGLPLDVAEPRSAQTVLHIAAANGVRNLAEMVSETGRADHLARDASGRLPSDLAYLFANDLPLSRYLAAKEREQAQTRGVDLLQPQRI